MADSTTLYKRRTPPNLPDNGLYVADELKRIEQSFKGIPALQAEVDALETDVAALETEVATLETDVAALEDAIEAIAVDVRTFGAVGDSNNTPGNGTDDTAAIQAAINALPGSGGILNFGTSTGSYRITNHLTTGSKRVIFQGTGWSVASNTNDISKVKGIFSDFDVGTAPETLLITGAGSAVRDLAFIARQTAPVSRTVTFTAGSPGTVNAAGSNLAAGTAVVFSNSGGALPAAIVADRNYYVASTGLTANSFQICEFPGTAAINIATAGTGTHSAATFSATTNPWAIRLFRAAFANEGGNEVGIENVMILNHSHGVWLDGSFRTRIDGLYGQPLVEGIRLSQQFDVNFLNNIYFGFPYAALVTNGITNAFNSIIAWTQGHATAGVWGRVDTPSVTNWFSYGYCFNWHFFAEDAFNTANYNADGTTTGLDATNVEFDAANQGIYCQSNGVGAAINNFRMACAGRFSFPSINGFGINVAGSDFSQLFFSNGRIENADFPISVAGSGSNPNKVSIANLFINNSVHTLGTTNALITANATSLVAVTGADLRPGAGQPLSSGNVFLPGALIAADVALGSAVSLSTGTQTNLTSIALNPGTWDVWCYAIYRPASTTQINTIVTTVSTTSATIDETLGHAAYFGAGGLALNPTNLSVPVGPVRVVLTAATTVYGAVVANFATSTMTVYGRMEARRVTG